MLYSPSFRKGSHHHLHLKTSRPASIRSCNVLCKQSSVDHKRKLYQVHSWVVHYSSVTQAKQATATRSKLQPALVVPCSRQRPTNRQRRGLQVSAAREIEPNNSEDSSRLQEPKHQRDTQQAGQQGGPEATLQNVAGASNKQRPPNRADDTEAADRALSQSIQQPKQQQQPAAAVAQQLPHGGRLRNKLKELLQQQQQLQAGGDSYAGATPSSNSSIRRSRLRAAAAGSTDWLLSLLQSQLIQLTGQVPVQTAADSSTDEQQQSSEVAAAAASSYRRSSGSTPDRHQQQQQHKKRQLQRQQPQQQVPAYVPLLAEALNTISWHCKRQQLLPAEAARLQQLMLQALLPALQPYLASVNGSQLARVVYALGSCASSSWEPEEQQQQPQHVQLPPQQQEQQQQQQGFQDAGSGTSAASDPVMLKADAQHQSTIAAASTAISKTSAAVAAATNAAASAAWVQQLLPLLPPSHLTAGALLAVWQGCALHEVRPAPQWLSQACWAMHGHLMKPGKLDFNDLAGLLQACAALSYCPPGWLMVPLVAGLQQKLGLLNPADLAGVLRSLQDLSYRPSDTWLRLWCEVSSKLMRGMTFDQLASAAGALAWAGYSPKPWWGQRLLAAAQPLLPVATADELLLLLHSLLGLRVAAKAGVVHEAYCHLAQMRGELSLSQLADAAHVLGSMRLPVDLVKTHRRWLAGCLRNEGAWRGAAAAAELSRSELLYMMYAAARLRVSPAKTLLTASLSRLHAELPQASPAELAGCFSVFCFWWKRQRDGLADRKADRQADRGADVMGGSGVAIAGEPVAAGSISSSSKDSGATVSSNTGIVPAAGRLSKQQLVALERVRDCLAAVAGCRAQFSDEGLLQLLLTSADAALPPEPLLSWQQQQPRQQQQQLPQVHKQQQPQWHQQEHLSQDIQMHIDDLVAALVGRLSEMSLVQLSRMCRALEVRVTSSSSMVGANAGSSRPAWYQHLLHQVKSAMASRA